MTRASAPAKNAMNIKRVIKDLQKRSEKSLLMAKDTALRMNVESTEIKEALRHYTKYWNDYVHPGLVSIACEAAGGNPDETVPMQVVMLMLTAAADIHDDIIDESKTKYGKPTVFGRFGKDITLLVGDAFLMRALTLLHESRSNFPEEEANEIWNIVTTRFFELGEAEALETGVKGNINISSDEYFRILEKKASTFEAHMRIGALIGRGDPRAVDLLGNYGKTFGILISIREDFIDTFEPDELQNRMRNECLPLPILYAFKNPEVKKTILHYLSKPKISIRGAERIVNIIFNDKNVELLRDKIRNMVEKANVNIGALENEKTKSQLSTLIRSIAEGL